jgi:hypothetical protein
VVDKILQHVERDASQLKDVSQLKEDNQPKDVSPLKAENPQMDVS